MSAQVVYVPAGDRYIARKYWGDDIFNAMFYKLMEIRSGHNPPCLLDAVREAQAHVVAWDHQRNIKSTKIAEKIWYQCCIKSRMGFREWVTWQHV